MPFLENETSGENETTAFSLLGHRPIRSGAWIFLDPMSTYNMYRYHLKSDDAQPMTINQSTYRSKLKHNYTTLLTKEV